MNQAKVSDNFYDRTKPRLYKRVGRELRLAYRVLDLGCGQAAKYSSLSFLAIHWHEIYGTRTTLPSRN